MSRAYRISVRESLSRHVQVEDGVRSSLELLPILPQERLAALLAAELAAGGYQVEGAVARKRQGEGIEVVVELASGEVSVRAVARRHVELEAHRTDVVEVGTEDGRAEALKAAAREALEKDAAAEETALRQRVTAQLEGALRDLKGELDGVVNRVTATALKQRAAELGTVEEVHEDGAGNLTIKVRV